MSDAGERIKAEIARLKRRIKAYGNIDHLRRGSRAYIEQQRLMVAWFDLKGDHQSAEGVRDDLRELEQARETRRLRRRYRLRLARSDEIVDSVDADPPGAEP